MCGRYTIYTKKESLEERFGAEMTDEFLYNEHYNAAPSQMLPVVESSAPEMITFSYWGFQPSWAKSDSKFRAMINARGETVAEKPFFRGSFKHKRCMVLANGFFEWKKVGEKKVPYYITLKDKGMFAMAGIWDENAREDMQPNSFAIITTEANGLMKEIHHRMPVILHKEDEKKWLDESLSKEEAVSFLQQYPEEEMQMHEVTTKMNRPTFNVPTAIAKI